MWSGPFQQCFLDILWQSFGSLTSKFSKLPETGVHNLKEFKAVLWHLEPFGQTQMIFISYILWVFSLGVWLQNSQSLIKNQTSELPSSALTKSPWNRPQGSLFKCLSEPGEYFRASRSRVWPYGYFGTNIDPEAGSWKSHDCNMEMKVHVLKETHFAIYVNSNLRYE